MSTILSNLLSLLNSGETFTLATILRHVGSTPRSVGTRMVVLPDGSILGTIGGGKLEAQVIQEALRVMNGDAFSIKDYHFTGKDAASMDMICGGAVNVLVEPIRPGKDPIDWILAWSEILNGGQRGWLITKAGPDGVTHQVVRPDDPAGNLPGSLVDLEAVHEATGVAEFGQVVMVERISPGGRALIFGGGHVSRALAEVLSLTGFPIVVVDDREEFANAERFPSAKILAVSPIENAFDTLVPEIDDSIVIVTRGHLQDEQVLEAALRTPAGYIGMIGSRRKRELIYQSLRAKGVGEEALGRIYSPIGLPIGAETPEEIAVSIAAEIIQARSRRMGRIASI